MKKELKRIARNIKSETRVNRRFVKKLRKLGVSNQEIAKALGIPEDSPILQEDT